MTKPKEAIKKLWHSQFFINHQKTSEVKNKCFLDYHCTCSNWETLLRSCDFIRKETKGWVQKSDPPQNNENMILFVSGKQPWTDRNEKFVDFINKLHGEILILDPYYGIDTLQILSKFPKDKKIRFLTAQLGKDENENIIKKDLVRFKKEFTKISMAIYPKFFELHDRYILSDDFFIVVGHGFKDFGNKECFFIGLPTKEIKELTKDLRILFEERWKNSKRM